MWDVNVAVILANMAVSLSPGRRKDLFGVLMQGIVDGYNDKKTKQAPMKDKTLCSN